MRKNAWMKRLLVLTLTASMLPASSMTVSAAAAPDGKTDATQTVEAYGGAYEEWLNEWNTSIKDDWTQMSLTPGSDESQLNFAWYSKQTEGTPCLKIGVGRKMTSAKTYTAVQTLAQTATDGTVYMSNKVTATDLKADTEYYYTYQVNGKYITPIKYTTQSTDKFSFIYVGDPQIGSSNELKGTDTQEFYDAQSAAVANDTFNWNTTLNQAVAKSNNEASFVLSAGDQIQTTKKKAPNKSTLTSEIEYAGYLSPDALESLPVATTVGNHDADNANYVYHFNTPNASDLGSNGTVGGDYWFTYDNALFIMLNTQDTNVTEHKQFIEQAVAANQDCKWRIVTLHQDIYGSAEHSNEPEITNLRYSLVPYFEENEIDVVLTGHDHAYSRSKILSGGTKTTEYTDDEFDEQLDKDMDAGENPTTLYTAPGNIADTTTDSAELAYLDYLNQVMDASAVQTEKKDGDAVINPTGILYMTANSSSGSKYYDLVPRQQTYIANRWQEDVPTYSIIDISDTTFTIDTYRTDTDEQIDETYTIAKVEINKTELNSQIAAADKEITVNKADYTDASYQTFATALAAAKAVTADTTATNSEVEAALQSLIQAKAGLVQIPTESVQGSLSAVTAAKIANQAYTGKTQQPAITLTAKNGTVLKQGTDYTVTYKNNKNIGTATIFVKGTGSYTGTKNIVFKIVPKKVTLTSVKKSGTSNAVVKYKKVSGSVTGYSVTYSTNSKFKSAKTKTAKSLSCTLKSLKSGKTYYVKVRAYKKVNGTVYYGAYSKTKTIKR